MGPPVIITVTHGQVEVFPPRAHVSVKGQEEVRWICPQGEAIINFVTSPFSTDRYVCPKNGSVSTGFASGKPGVYKYSVIVHIPSDRREYVIDPEIEIGE